MNEFVTWEFLSSFAGAAAMTAIITQVIKKPLEKVPTQVISYVVALVILLVSNFFVGGLTVSSAALIFINALCVSLSANGGYDAVVRAKNTVAKK